jgi:hypothetical protein
VSHIPGPHLRAPYAGDFGTGPNVCVTVPADAEITCLVYEDGVFTEVHIGGDANGGVFVTLPTAGLDFLIAELEAVRDGAINPSGFYLGSRWAPAAVERAANAARPVLLPAQKRSGPTPSGCGS